MARQEAAVTIQAHGSETRTQRERGGKGSFRTHQLREEFDVGMEGVNGEDSRVCGLEPGMGGHAGQGSGQGRARGRAGAGAPTGKGRRMREDREHGRGGSEREPRRDAVFPCIPEPLSPWF